MAHKQLAKSERIARAEKVCKRAEHELLVASRLAERITKRLLGPARRKVLLAMQQFRVACFSDDTK
jgi:hypothetical protein